MQGARCGEYGKGTGLIVNQRISAFDVVSTLFTLSSDSKYFTSKIAFNRSHGRSQPRLHPGYSKPGHWRLQIQMIGLGSIPLALRILEQRNEMVCFAIKDPCQRTPSFSIV